MNRVTIISTGSLLTLLVLTLILPFTLYAQGDDGTIPETTVDMSGGAVIDANPIVETDSTNIDTNSLQTSSDPNGAIGNINNAPSNTTNAAGQSSGPKAYKPLVGVPGVDTSGTAGFTKYLQQLFVLTIIAGAMIAVVKMSIAGFKWMMTDSITSKSDARADITGALLGLAILLATYVVLNTINPNLTNLDVLRNAQNVSTQTSGGTGVPAALQEKLDDKVEREEAANKQAAGEVVAGDFGDRCRATGATPFVYGKSAKCVEPTIKKDIISFSSQAEAAAAAAACEAAGGEGSTAANGSKWHSATCSYVVIDQSVYIGQVGEEARTNCTNKGGIPYGQGLVNCKRLSTDWPPK